MSSANDDDVQVDETQPAGEVLLDVTPGAPLVPRPAAAPARRRRTRLHNIRAVRAHLATIARDLSAEDLTVMRVSERTQHHRARIYCAQVLGTLIQATEMEARLTELERLILTRGV